MSLLDYTTYAEVRAALGVNDVELTDETLGLDMFSSSVSIELDEIDPTLVETYGQILNSDDRTKSQQRLFDVTRLFATYSVAKSCGSLPMFGPKTISDSKTEVSRFANDPYKETMKFIAKEWDKNRGRVQTALAAVRSSDKVSVTLNVFAVSTPTVNEVTG